MDTESRYEPLEMYGRKILQIVMGPKNKSPIKLTVMSNYGLL